MGGYGDPFLEFYHTDILMDEKKWYFIVVLIFVFFPGINHA
jgi:hypothetical protein